MGFLDLDQMFTRLGHSGHRRARGPRGAAIDSLVAETRRELAVLSADLMGAHASLGQFGGGHGTGGPTRGGRRMFRDMIEGADELFMVIDPRPGLHIVDVNDAYAAATLTNRRRTAGEKLFDVFPDNPYVTDADGMGNLYESLQRAAQSGKPHEMAVQRYDVQDEFGGFVERHWKCTNIPILDDQGRVIFVLHHAADVTPIR